MVALKPLQGLSVLLRIRDGVLFSRFEPLVIQSIPSIDSIFRVLLQHLLEKINQISAKEGRIFWLLGLDVFE